VSDAAPDHPVPPRPNTLAGGRYLLGDRLGAGGMGIVVRATDDLLHREVAVKLLADNLAADPDARERFLREARSAARISDPQVVQVFDVGEEGGRPYQVMELVEGPSLADTLAADGPLDPDQVVDVAADALAGVARAHDAGLLHRDLKPGNLLRAPDGTVKVADFGVAEAADAPGLTRTGLVIGTRSYLAPERAAGQSATVRTDLYALGATLVELLSGRPPAGEDPLSAVRELRLPERLSHLLDRMLSRDPQQRPASARAALALLAGEVDADVAAVGEATRPWAVDVPGAQDDPAADGPGPRRDAAAGGPPPAPPAVDTSDATVPVDRRTAEAHGAPGPAEAPTPDGTHDPVGVPGAEVTALESPRAAGTAGAEDGRGAGESTAAPDRSGGVTISWKQLAVISVLLLAVAVAFQTMGGTDDEPPLGDPGVEREADPADTARNLGDWLRDRAGQ
jgi:eukaryotic-like serine/threonine-protein kinase